MTWPLKEGFTHHNAEIERTTNVDNMRVLGWRATCKACGWEGPDQMMRAAAGEDAAGHDLSLNPRPL